MNKTAIYSTIVVSVIASLAILAVSSSEIEAVPPFKGACPAENVQHWYKVTFGPNQLIEHDTEPDITNISIMTIPITTDEVFDSVIQRQLVADKLNSQGYFVNVPPPRPVEITDVGTGLGDANYFSTICAEN